VPPTLAVTMAPTPTPCDIVADVVFLVDGSGSVSTAGFDASRSFVAGVAAGVRVSPTRVRVGVSTFDDRVEANLFLSNGTSQSAVAMAVGFMLQPGGGTNLAQALDFVASTMYSGSHGGRPPPVSRVLVVLTDGQSSNMTATAESAASLRDDFNVQILAVGVGSAVNQGELLSIAGSAASVVDVLDSTQLFAAVHSVSQATCLLGTPPTATPTGQPTVAPSLPTTAAPSYAQQDLWADLAFLVDGSGSVRPEGFALFRAIVGAVSGGIVVSPSRSRISIATFDDRVAANLLFAGGTSPAGVSRAIDFMLHPGGGTDTARALDFVGNTIFESSNGARGPPVARVLILLTDGVSVTPSATLIAAQALRFDHNVRIIAVGVGHLVNETELIGITGNQSCVFTMAATATLDWALHIAPLLQALTSCP
jgi:Mg-chelatase subunit ChlD